MYQYGLVEVTILQFSKRFTDRMNGFVAEAEAGSAILGYENYERFSQANTQPVQEDAVLPAHSQPSRRVPCPIVITRIPDIPPWWT